MSGPALCQWCAAELAPDSPTPHCSTDCAEREARGTLRPDERDRVEYLAGQRLPDALIAQTVRVSSRGWGLLRKNDALFREALARGRAREHLALLNALFAEAVENRNVQAAQFLLRCRHGYTDKPDGDTARVLVQIALPGALSPAQYAELVNVAALPVIDAEAEPAKQLTDRSPGND